MLELKLNKKYTITTNQRNIVALPIKVVCILSYEEAKKEGFDIFTLGVNEKVISEDYQAYMNENQYYKCESLTDNNVKIIVWSDIIDGDKSNLLESTYSYNIKLNVPSTTTTPITSIISDLSTYLTNKYGVSVGFTAISGDDNTVIDNLKKQLESYSGIINSLNSLKVVIPSIERVVNGELDNRVTNITDKLVVIDDKLTTISIGLGTI